MKKKIVLYIFLLFTIYISAQNTIVEYNFRLVPFGDSSREFLMYNDKESYYFDFVDGKKTPVNEIINNYKIIRGGQKAYRKLDDINKVFRINAYPTSGHKHYLIIDDKPSIDWKIGKDKKDILGYTCTSATGSFRGREYTVWFTTQIPVSLGPWKLDGLPGLILKAEDKGGTFAYEAVQIIKNSNLEIPASVFEFMEKVDKNKIKTYRDFIEQENISFKTIQEKSIANLPKGTSGNMIVPPLREYIRETSFEWEESKKP
ncbi:GLPGLI family protein [Chryseobacterium phocaeense]|uniref:GLPGLI family protein n=1 Tax=Chryseobacterium phocaeense TaxID=1816690 RepID=UPI001E6209CC|nr:GLPGLI family protein [Chryseobacterium phocaeense]